MQQINQITSHLFDGIDLELANQLLPRMNKVFICKADQSESVLEEAKKYYQNNPGEDYA